MIDLRGDPKVRPRCAWLGCAFAAIGLALASSSAYAGSKSTMGFIMPFELSYSAAGNLNWISLPWTYKPQDVGTIGVLDAEDLCSDLGGFERVLSVVRWNEATSTMVEHQCGAPVPFALVKGFGYGVRNVPDRTINSSLVGSHDNGHAFAIVATGGSQLSWISVPYHLRIPEKGGSLGVNAEDLCRQIGGAEVLAVVRWDPSSALFESYGCGSVFVSPFELVRGQAYGLVNRGVATISWLPVHF